jgi:streptomycin 6-kinase
VRRWSKRAKKSPPEPHIDHGTKPHNLAAYVEKWRLSNVLKISGTVTGDIFKVDYRAQPAILKIFKSRNAGRWPARALEAFQGQGAVHLFEQDQGACLMEFAEGPSLKTLVEKDGDNSATEILCQTIAKLHTSELHPFGDLPTLDTHFESLFERAKREIPGSLYRSGANMIKKLLRSPRKIKVLHGDLHHENVLFSSKRGWLAIDPKGLVGEDAYEVANTFYNPRSLSGKIGSLESIQTRCHIFSERLNRDSRRILEFTFAHGCLSAAWHEEDEESPVQVLAIAQKILSLLN